MPFGVSQSFFFHGAEGSTRVWGFWCLLGVMEEEEVWAKWDEDFSGSSLKERQHSGRDGLITPTDIVPKAVCGGLNSWPQKVHWCPCRFPSFLPGIDQPCRMKLLLLNTSSARKSEERREFSPKCPPMPWPVPSHPYSGDVCSFLQVKSSREFLL